MYNEVSSKKFVTTGKSGKGCSDVWCSLDSDFQLWTILNELDLLILLVIVFDGCWMLDAVPCWSY